MSWTPLHVHSQYSILDALGSVKEVVAKAADLNISALALTDNGNLFGAVEFFKACQEKNIHPILGFEAYIAPESRHHKKRVVGLPTYSPLVLLAKNLDGYHNLCRISSQGYLEGFYYRPRIDKELLEQYASGLICLIGGVNSILGFHALNSSKEKLFEEIRWYQNLFGEDFYLELQRHPMTEEDLQMKGFYQETWLLHKHQEYIEKQEKVNALLLEASKEYDIPCVATNDSRYLNREDWHSHEILLNVQSGEPCEIWEKDAHGNNTFRASNPKRQTYPSHEIYFKSPEQMADLFQDLPEAIANTQKIADNCQVKLDFQTKHYPVYVPPALHDTSIEFDDAKRNEEVEKYLRQLCEEGIGQRYTPERLAKVQEVYPDRDPLEVVKERLQYEMSVLAPKKLCDYLLIVWDFIHWAKQRGIPVGPGRGSGAGSIILYLIGVTDIEPLQFHLFFERFINPERLSYPDIDVDICMQGREQVIDYTVEKYGKENVAQIITFGTMKAKMAIKDVARVLSVPLSKVNSLAKLIPEDPNMTLDKALEIDADLARLYTEDEEVKRIFDIGKKLEGSIRSTGIHAAGVIICGDPLTDHIPLCRAKDSSLAATQFSMKPVETVGMLKIDFLGLKALTCIQMCVDAIKENTGTHIDWVNLPLDDRAAFDLLNQGKTMGIFQMESGGMQDLARGLHLDHFEEIIAVGALYRPGPMDMIPSFIARKHGREPIEYDHPWMKEILAETYGIMVYQEQVMQIAQKLANYSLGEGDVLRKAMGKKDAAQMAEQREKFRSGALANGIDDELATAIFDKMEKFASYGFNKSHAAAYGYLTYTTAYLKANYPKQWLAALMTCDRTDTTKIAKFIGDAQAMGIAILPPDVNEAGATFTASPQGIRFAMVGIKGVGAGVVEAIIEERQKNGPFTGLYEFMKRTDAKKVGKKATESLIEAGCFDFTDWSRDALRENVGNMFDRAQKEKKEEAVGMLDLFSTTDDAIEKLFSKPPKVKYPRSNRQTWLKEKELLGFFLTGHPMDEFQQILTRISCIPLKEVEQAQMEHDQVFRSAFLVEEMAIRISSKSQKKFAILIVSDGLDRYELPIWPDLYESKGHLIRENQMLYAILRVDKREETTKLNCRWVDDLTQVNEAMIEACDHAFDREKNRSSQAAYARSKNPSPQEPVMPKDLFVSLDADQVRFSHILQLKRILKENPGPSSVQIAFHSAAAQLATLHINGQKGVSAGKQALEKIREIPAVTNTKLS